MTAPRTPDLDALYQGLADPPFATARALIGAGVPVTAFRILRAARIVTLADRRWDTAALPDAGTPALVLPVVAGGALVDLFAFSRDIDVHAITGYPICPAVRPPDDAAGRLRVFASLRDWLIGAGAGIVIRDVAAAAPVLHGVPLVFDDLHQARALDAAMAAWRPEADIAVARSALGDAA